MNRLLALNPIGRAERRGGSVLWLDRQPGDIVAQGEFWRHRGAIASWMTIPFVRLTSSVDTLDVSIRAAATADVGREGGIASVVFRVEVDGVPAGDVTVTTPSLRFPNFTDEPSRCPGVAVGTLAPFFGWGFTFAANSYAQGTITVRATVLTSVGSRTDLPALVFHNHKSGAAPPSTKVVYLDFDAGNDANNGTSWGQAVLTAKRAQDLARNNPAGGTLADQNAGGAKIWCRGTAIGGSGFGGPSIHTEQFWLTFEADPVAGCTWRRFAPPTYTAGSDTLYAGAGAGTICNIRFKGIDFRGAGPVVQVSSGCLARTWQDGGTHRSQHYLGEGQWSVRFAEDNGAALSFDASDADMRRVQRFATGVDRAACSFGITGHTFVHDVDVHEFLGTVMQINGYEGPSTYSAVRLRGQRYAYRVVQGYVRLDGTANGVAVPSLTTSIPSAGVLRITGPVGGYDFGLDAEGCAGSTYWGINCTGLPSGCNGTWAYVGRGSTSGAPYLDLACGSATAGSVSAGVATLITARLANGSPYYVEIHPDGLQWEGTRAGDVVADWVLEDTPSMQSFFTSGQDHERLLLENVRDDGSALVLNLGDSSLTNSIVRNCTFAGVLQAGWTLSSERLAFTGTEIRNCVFGSYSANSTMWVTGGAVVDHCHFITGPGFGTSATTGAWFAGDPTAAPLYSFEPAAGKQGTGSTLLVEPEVWAWNDAPTRGVWKHVAYDSWNTTGFAFGAGSGSLTFGGSSSGTVGSGGVTGISSGTLPLTGSGNSAIRVAGDGSGTMPLGGAAAGAVRVAGAGSGLVGMAGDGAAAIRVAGAADGAIALGGDAAGVTRVAGAGDGVWSISGTGAGVVGSGVLGTGSGAIDLAGSGVGAVPTMGAGDGLLVIGGNAVGTVWVLGLAGGVLALAGNGAASAGGAGDIVGTGAGTLDLFGSGVGTAVMAGPVDGRRTGGGARHKRWPSWKFGAM